MGSWAEPHVDQVLEEGIGSQAHPWIGSQFLPAISELDVHGAPNTQDSAKLHKVSIWPLLPH